MVKHRQRLLIIDGYNVLRSGSFYRDMYEGPDYTDDAFNRARETLINDVVAYAGSDCAAVIVFDGGNNEFSTGVPEIVGGVRIIFSPAGSSADKVIEKLAYDARLKNIETMVVTSDASIQNTVFGDGVDRMSANGFSYEMRMHMEDAQLDTYPRVSRKTVVADRLSPEVRAKLEALRDGR